ncbi:MAG: aryldialkylphosphatase [Candidatus Dormibacteraeota bacterium]|nr:aryldialkylphosphatase [Candidatus Dormibacteraeota bacterium]
MAAPYIQTVTGPVEPSTAGHALMHEHATSLVVPGWSDDETHDAQVELAARALERFGLAGGSLVVDLTTIEGMAASPRDVAKMARISEESGLKIVAASAFYKDPFLPEWVTKAALDELAELHVREATQGVDGTGIRVGIFGEVGSGLHIITPNEEKCLRAVARAHRETGVPISTHCSLGTMALEQLDIFESEGADLSKVVLGHLDLNTPDDYIDEVIGRGVTIGFDTWGKEWFDYVVPDSEGQGEGAFVKWTYRRPDAERLRALIRLLQRGAEKQVVLSMDITGAELYSNPGTIGLYGYAFLHTQILPLLQAEGIRDSVLEVMLMHNPARILTIG